MPVRETLETRMKRFHETYVAGEEACAASMAMAPAATMAIAGYTPPQLNQKLQALHHKESQTRPHRPPESSNDGKKQHASQKSAKNISSSDSRQAKKIITEANPTMPSSNVSDIACILCQESKAQVIFEPCSHRILCSVCLERFYNDHSNGNNERNKFCPSCRVPIQSISKPTVARSSTRILLFFNTNESIQYLFKRVTAVVQDVRLIFRSRVMFFKIYRVIIHPA